jgi:hypothetical protein
MSVAMRMNRQLGSGLLVLALACAATPSLADDCLDFKWDVSKERALFAANAQILKAGKDVGSAPTVVPDRLFKLTLTPQEQVSFSAAPARKAAASGAYAGLVALKLPATGSYRIALDLPFWIDVVSNGALVPAKDFEGQHACAAPHKIVEFELSGSQSYIVQLSGAAGDTVQVTVTAAPARKF